MNTLNPLQLEILKLFKNYKSESELLKLKKVLIDYLSKKLVAEADTIFDEKGYDANTIEEWEKEHMRSRS